MIGGLVAGGVGISTVALPASAAPGFNSYIGYTDPEGDIVSGETYVFSQVNRREILINWKRAPESSVPEAYTVYVEAYYIPPGNASPASNPFNYRAAPNFIATMNPASVSPLGVYLMIWGPGSMFPSLSSSQLLQGTRFRATFVTSDSPSRSVSVPFDGLGLGDRWEYDGAPA